MKSGNTDSSFLALNRTFSPVGETGTEAMDFDYELYRRFAAANEALTWDGLLECPVLVILGEAGIGKTYELKGRTEQLIAEGRAAFFLPLNTALDKEALKDLLANGAIPFESWLGGKDSGYFFLDSIDEARLKSLADLESALRNVIRLLKPGSTRASFVISSRITDWYTPGMQEMVQRVICDELLRHTEDKKTRSEIAESLAMNLVPNPTDMSSSQKRIQPEVFALDPLSSSDAKQLACLYGVENVEDFWHAVEKGGYTFMATRPLDLKWMADSWKTLGRLGGLTEMLETSIEQRLREVNLYHAGSGQTLPPMKLREGSELLAVTCVLSGRPFISTTGDPITSNTNFVVDAAGVLSDWDQRERDELLNTAVFDEASYGRVRFHHRVVREYLAANWILRRMEQGLPLKDAEALFIHESFNQPVLIRSRRQVLGWLASKNRPIRESVIQKYPGIIFHGGDAEKWDDEDIEAALRGYLSQIKEVPVSDWIYDSGICGRIGRRAGASVLNQLLEENRDSPEILYWLLLIVQYATLADCSETVYSLYASTDAAALVEEASLRALKLIATPEHRQSIRTALLGGAFTHNKLRSLACEILFPYDLSITDLLNVLRSADSEPAHPPGFLSRFLKKIIPLCNDQMAADMLEGLLNLLPENSQTINNGQSRERYGWLAGLLPSFFLAVLNKPSCDQDPILALLHRAVIYIDALNRYSYWDSDSVQQIGEVLLHRPELRHTMTLAIAGTDPGNGPSRVAGPFQGSIIRLTKEDIPWVERLANDATLPAPQRQVAFNLLMAITHQCPPSERRRLLREAIRSCDSEQRRGIRLQEIVKRREYLRTARLQKSWERERVTAIRQQNATTRRDWEENLDLIRSGKYFPALRETAELMIYAHSGGSGKWSVTNLEVVVDKYGFEIAQAVAEGFKQFWRQREAPLPREGSNNLQEGSIVFSLIGIAMDVGSGLDISHPLPVADIKRLSRYALWEIGGVPPWFETLATAHPQDVADAIWPEIEAEIPGPLSSEERRMMALDILANSPLPLKEALASRMRETLDRASIQVGPPLRTVLQILHSTGTIDSDYLADKVSPILNSAAKEGNWGQVGGWLAFWLGTDLERAWSSFEEIWRSTGDQSEQNAVNVAAGIHSGALPNFWGSFELMGALPDLTGMASVLENMFEFFNFHILRENDIQHRSGEGYRPDARDFAQEFRDAIPQRLRAIPGAAAHATLARLLEKHKSSQFGWQLHRLMVEHASDEAERASILDTKDISGLGDVYCRTPRSEADLFQIALARMDVIKEGIEQGPYSDRVLFFNRMPESNLQIWLAARLLDTPNRRFGVSREDAVDHRKKPDIHLHHQVGKVCIEIKPADDGRYSAEEFRNQLIDQLVGQYMGGLNSRHGILVLFLLKKRTWRIPSGNSSANFEELLAFLQTTSDELRINNARVEGLKVIGINCTGISDEPLEK
jgi:hypothetical protein